ncbi:DJ-1/PfpI family protein [Amycolatopsis sp. OK19-0408]|uniref:DJ-1/PfpI family protein n=1 Tax=Amycolatopsis iheyensis TaxID=2945988 RepID=A0A9X2NJI6_9PSEU|nr:DJ-1/PfpI family protein [Amycolatopsis iheyensis]MCR6487940.1 DJ-1/PfpI family protein [Amycolatopsis iheyensis]
MRTRPVLVVLYDDVRLLDVSGPLEVFAEANEHGGRYDLKTASPGGADVRANTGTRLGADLDLAQVDPRGATVLVPGGPEWVRTIADAELIAQIRRLAGGADRTASVCAGAFALAAAGVLDGRRATTHWDLAGQLARRFPLVRVDADAIFVQDGPVLTSAGVTSGIDLALALVEADLGAEVARLVAKHLVVFLQRPGGQSQFSVRLETGRPRTEVLRGVLDSVAADPSAPHTAATMAARAGVSPRHLTRLFHDELGRTPARFVEQVRLEFAQQQLERTTDPLDVVARRSGFGTAETLRRAFARGLGVTPSDYRARFRTTGVG